MKIYTTITVRANGNERPVIRAESFTTKEEANDALEKAFDDYVKEKHLDLSYPSTDGMAFIDWGNFFEFCPYNGGDWSCVGKIIETTV